MGILVPFRSRTKESSSSEDAEEPIRPLTGRPGLTSGPVWESEKGGDLGGEMDQGFGGGPGSKGGAPEGIRT